MSEAEAAARRVTRMTWACLAAGAVGLVLSVSVSGLFVLVTVPAFLFGWAFGFFCAKAKGYPTYFGLIGPLFVVALPSLHPVYDDIRRWEATRAPAPPPPDAPPPA